MRNWTGQKQRETKRWLSRGPVGSQPPGGLHPQGVDLGRDMEGGYEVTEEYSLPCCSENGSGTRQTGTWQKPGLSGIRTGEMGQAGLAHDEMSSGSLSGGVSVQEDAIWGGMQPRAEAADGYRRAAVAWFGPVLPKVGSVKHWF